MKKNGFTLIELIAVIIIMGLILIIVSPSLSRLLQSGDEKKYTQYYDLVIKAAEKYSREREGELGGVSHSGCVENITTKDLIEKEYLKEFKEDDVVCGTPNEDKILGVVEDGYTDIRINNKNGKIEVTASLVCIDKRKNIKYSNLIKKEGACVAYIPEVKSTLYEGLKNITTYTTDGDTRYITGNSPNNYILYSGRLWRAISYNEQNRITRAILDEPATILNFDSASSTLQNSNVDIWLKNVFLNTLRSPDIYLDDAIFDNTSVENANKPTSPITYTSKVGLLSLYEYSKVKDYVSTSDSFFLSSKNNNNIWIAKSGKQEESVSINAFSTIRPVIVFKGNVAFQAGGDGTKTNPYKVSGESTANTQDKLNSRYVGEYLTFADSTYRIIETNNDYTKIISTGLLNNLNSVFSSGDSKYSEYNTIGTLVSYEWYQNTLSEENRNKIYLNSYCATSITGSSKYNSACPLVDLVNVNVALPAIGEMYTTKINAPYFTITKVDSNNVYTIGNEVVSTPAVSSSGVRVVLSLKSNVRINSGKGTSAEPYVLAN